MQDSLIHQELILMKKNTYYDMKVMIFRSNTEKITRKSKIFFTRKEFILNKYSSLSLTEISSLKPMMYLTYLKL